MGRSPPERPESDLWPERYGREIPPPLDPRGEILSMSTVAGQTRVRRAGRPDEDAARRRDRLRRIYAVYIRECIEGQYGKTPGFRDFWRGEPGNKHWRSWCGAYRAGYLAGQAGAGEDVALEDHEAWTERIMAMPAGRGLRIVDTEEGPLPLLPGTMFLTDAEERTPGPEVSECDKEVAEWLKAELAHAAPDNINGEIGPGFPEVQDEQPASEVIEGGEPGDEEPDTDGA